jgi:hypothetical protein
MSDPEEGQKNRSKDRPLQRQEGSGVKPLLHKSGAAW